MTDRPFDQRRLVIVTSNRLERLVDLVAEHFARDPLPPLEQEVVVVQSQGLRRWLTLELARRRGIAGSLTTPFPRPLVRWLARRVLDAEDLPASEPVPRDEDALFGRELMAWRLFAELGRARQRPAEAPTLLVPLTYLDDDRDQRKRYQLAVRLAGLFDDYQVFRPDLLRRFEIGETSDQGDEAWQATLWRHLLDAPDDAPLHQRIDALQRVLHDAAVAPPGLPRRLTVLGVSSLPPAFLDLLASLSRWLPVLIAFTSPTYHYWADLRSERETARLARRLELDGPALDEQHFTEGHPLLAALGRQGRDFFRLLQALDTTGSAWHELDFVDPLDGVGQDRQDSIDPPAPALAVLQSDILHLRRRLPSERLTLAAIDTSFEVHACHSPMREMEVLRDRLLDLFASPPHAEAAPWRPGDVLVMVPDIDLYGPYIQAVFGVERTDTPTIPFALADRRAGRERPPAETFLDVVDLLGARITVREVFDLLDTPAIRHRFGLATDDLPTLRRFADATRVRWALDGPHKARHFDVPADSAHTWRAGLDRWLLGYATGETDELVADMAPHAGDTTGFIDTLGRFALYMDTLGETLRRLERPRAPKRWACDLAAAIDALFAAEDEVDERGLQWLRDAVHQLAEAEHRAAVDGPVSARVAFDHLRRALDGEGFGSGFVDGRITFCRLEPMRSVPFRMIAVCGLDDGAFPRRNREIGFDLMAKDPRPGDRTPRDDDRYLFLETLLAARERLHLSYVGRSQKDSSEREPSVVLAELLDQLDRTFVGSNGGTAHDQLVIEHRLQPWSPSYFAPAASNGSDHDDAERAADPRRQSHSVDDAAGARALVGPRHRVPRFADAPLAPPETDESTAELELEALIRFAILPCRSYLERLQLRLDDRDAEHDLPDAEPFDLDGLAAYRLRQAMSEARLQPDFDADRERRQLSARGELPAARLGVATYRQLARRVDAFVDRLPAIHPEPPRRLRIDGIGRRVVGRVEGLSGRELLRFRCIRQATPPDLLRVWIEHLAVAVATPGPRRRTRLITESEAWIVEPAIDPAAHLADLVAMHMQGALVPLPIFPRSSHAFAVQAHAQRDPRSRSRRSPLDRARDVFIGRDRDPLHDGAPPEAEHPSVRLAFRGVDPLDDPEFGAWAERLWRPLLDHLKETRP